MIITIIIAASVAAWFYLEAEAAGKSKPGWITLGLLSYLIPMFIWSIILAAVVTASLQGPNMVAELLVNGCSQGFGLLAAAILRWRVSKKTSLELKPNIMLVAFVILAHVALLVILLIGL